MRRLTPLLLAAGCAAPSPLPVDVDACGSTCGDGPVVVLDVLEFTTASDDGVVVGFDLDGLARDCDRDDLVAPDGTTGIDNQFAAVLEVLPAASANLLPAAIQSAIDDGRMSILFEVVGPTDLQTDGPAAVVARLGAGRPFRGTDGRLLRDQTFELDPDPLLGVAQDARVEGGRLLADPFELIVRLDFLGTPVRFRLLHTRVALTVDAEGEVAGVVGGIIPLEDAMQVITLIGGDDTDLQEALAGLLPHLVDIRTSADSSCDGISAALNVHGKPAFIFDDGT